MATVLVTGGAGYVGSHVCKALALAGHLPVTYDNLSRGHRSAVKWGPLETGDLLDRQNLDAVIKKHSPTAVMHFAAYALVGESVKHPDMYFRNNVDGSTNLLDSMAQAGVKNIVFSSSCAVYGEPESTPISESTLEQPVNPYGETKLIVEKNLRERTNTQDLSWCALRYFNAAGADPGNEIGEDHEPETHLIPNVLRAASGDREFIVNGNNFPTDDGTCVRDFVHVTDIADAHVKALTLMSESAFSEVINLGTGRGYSIMQVLEAAEHITGHKVTFRVGEPREGDPPVLIADNKKVREILKWHPKRSRLDIMIDDAWRWIKRDRDS